MNPFPAPTGGRSDTSAGKNRSERNRRADRALLRRGVWHSQDAIISVYCLPFAVDDERAAVNGSPRRQADVEAGGLARAHVDFDSERLKPVFLDAHAMRAFCELNQQAVL